MSEVFDMNSMSFLKNIESFNKRIWYGLFRLLFRVKPFELPLDYSNVHKVLLFRYDRMGDMVVSQAAIRYLHSKGVEVHVLCSAANGAVLDDSLLVRRRIVLGQSLRAFVRTIRDLRREDYDVIFCMVFHRSTNAGLLANLISRRAIKVGRLYASRRELYARLFNVQLDIASPRMRMPELLLHFCSAMEGKSFRSTDFDYRLDISEDRIKQARLKLSEAGLDHPVVINISAGHPRRNFDAQICDRIVEALDRIDAQAECAILCLDRDWEEAEEYCRGSAGRVRLLPSLRHILDSAAIIGLSRLVITPDTAVVHLADSQSIPTIAVYIDPSEYWFLTKSRGATLTCSNPDDISSFSNDELASALREVLS